MAQPNVVIIGGGLAGTYLAVQWVEPGGGVPLACTSGRRAVQVLCADRGVPFVIPPRSGASR